jgi:hypothetical protein
MLRIVITTGLLALAPTLVLADSLAVTGMVFGTGIEDHVVTGVDTVFRVDQGRIYCWTSVSGGGTGDTVFHAWSRDGKVVQRIPLHVEGRRYRTYSYKSLSPDLAGVWQVRVTDREGRRLAEDSVVVRAQEVSGE